MDRIVWQDGIYSKGKQENEEKKERPSYLVVSGGSYISYIYIFYFCLTNTLIFRSLLHIDFLSFLSLSGRLSHLKLSAYCPYFLLLLFQPELGRSSIRSSLSLSQDRWGGVTEINVGLLGHFIRLGHFRPIFW